METKNGTNGENKLAIALSMFYSMYNTNNNFDHTNDKLKDFIDEHQPPKEFSDLYKNIIFGNLSSRIEICNEIRHIYKNIVGYDMSFATPKDNSAIEPEPSADFKSKLPSEATSTPVELSTSETTTPNPSITQVPQTLAEKLKVDVHPVVAPKNNESVVINNNSFSFTRADGSKVTVEILDHITNLYYSQLHNCKITQVFPKLPNGSNIEVVTNIVTAIDLESLQDSSEYKATLKAALSAQNIYDATANHNALLYNGIPTFNQSSEEMLKDIENALLKQRLDSALLLNSHGSYERLIPVCEFHTPSPIPNVTQYEYAVTSFDFNKNSLKYLYSNIDTDKVHNDDNYKKLILSKIRQAEEEAIKKGKKAEDINSFFLIGSPNLRGEYVSMLDEPLDIFLKAYKNYVESPQSSIDDSNPGDDR